ncbi:hypothetical protein FQN49_000071 [Arthroderma sp. PD_2]|nr:hypothetical protein FQN49_000071 [Arthroderma sp. PD_2]
MIPPAYRFYVTGGGLFPEGPHTWDVIDWDLRRWFQVTGPAEALPEDTDGIAVVRRYVDQLSPDVHCLEIDAQGNLLSTSSKDPTLEIRYPEYSGTLGKGEVARRSQLTEIDRFHVCTDLVEYHPPHGDKEVVAFKYTLIQQRVKDIWDELYILKAFKGHNSIVQFHRVILDDVSEKVLGFTSEYIPGGTLEHYKDHNRPFYFRWMEQLTNAIDDINLIFGLMHQDIAPRNILYDPATESLKVFDFDRSALIGSKRQDLCRNDVDGLIFTIYETLTTDDQYRTIPFEEQDVAQVENLEFWKPVIPLEEGKGGIAAYRSFIAKWAAARRTTRMIQHYSEATTPIIWPAYTKPGNFIVQTETGNIPLACRTRTEALAAGDYVTCWERPPQQEKCIL